MKENKKPFSELLSDKRIINFLHCIAPEYTTEDEDEEYCIFFKRFMKGESLEELFKKNYGEDGEYFLKIKKKPDNVYDIEFGHQLFTINSDNGQKNCGGDSTIHHVTFDKNDFATCSDEAVLTHFD